MSDWRFRLRLQITLTAPDGTQFVAAWQGNDIEGAKRVGQFEHPLSDGTTTQDLGAGSLSYPLVFFFEGDDHDTEAWDFQKAFLEQRGPWDVDHPVYGTLKLQGISIKLGADPTASANVTRVETTWIEPAEEQDASVDTGSQITAQADVVNASSSDQFYTYVNMDDAEGLGAIAETGTQSLGQVQASPLAALAARSSEIQTQFLAAYGSVTDALALSPMDLATAIGGIQGLMQLPALVEGDITGTLAAYGSVIAGLIDSLVPGSDVPATNSTLVSELFLTAALVGVAEAIALSTPQTREQVVQAMDDANALFSAVTDGLDSQQDATAGNEATGQYFSASQTVSDLARLKALALAHLQRRLFDLKIARRFTLSVPRAPIEIAIAEYGDLGEFDLNLDFFIASNHLQGNDIILLPAGREVVVYV